ncbi:MAG: hypothetical protein RJA86_520 [Pseudomonadota bacterium]|jgi:hypothetical protein
MKYLTIGETVKLLGVLVSTRIICVHVDIL